jgi:peptidoglycan hydrolase CwlO-like protein
MKFSRGLRDNFKKLSKKYKSLKIQNDAIEVKTQQLERKVASLELKMENLGVSPDTTLKECISLKPHIQGTLTALAANQKTAISSFPKEEKKSVENFNLVAPGQKFKPR